MSQGGLMARRKNIFYVLMFLSIAGIGAWTVHLLFPSSFSFRRSPHQPPVPLSIGVVDINRIKADSKVFQKFKEVVEGLNATIHKEILDRETKLRAEFEQLKKREEEAQGPTQEILKQKNAHREMTESFDKVESAGEADWRTLAKFGVERNQVSVKPLANFGPVVFCDCFGVCTHILSFHRQF